MIQSPTIFVIDDDPSVLKSLERLVRSAGYQAATFHSAREFLTHPADDMPGCIVLDMRMPDISGFDLQQTLSACGNGLPIVFLTGYGDIPMSVRAIKSGAVDFLSKPCEDVKLLAAIDEAIAADAVKRKAKIGRSELQRRFASLTRREQEVCCHVVAGRLNKQIAYDLGVGEQTIKVHRMRIMEKLCVRSLADLVRLTQEIDMPLSVPGNSTLV